MPRTKKRGTDMTSFLERISTKFPGELSVLSDKGWSTTLETLKGGTVKRNFECNC